MSYLDEIAPDVITPDNQNDMAQPLKYLDNVIALYDFPGTQPNHLPLTLGDTIYVLSKNENGWWDGITVSTSGEITRGWFPNNYVRSVNYVQPILNKLKSNKELDSITAANTAANVLIPSFTSYLQKNLTEERSSTGNSRKNSIVSFASSDDGETDRKEKEEKEKDYDHDHFNSVSTIGTALMDTSENSLDVDDDFSHDQFQITPTDEAERLVIEYRKTHGSTPTWVSKPTIDGNLIYYSKQLEIYCTETPLFSIGLKDLANINFEVPSYDILNDTNLIIQGHNLNLTEDDLNYNDLKNDTKLNNFLKRDSNVSISSTNSSNSFNSYHHFIHPLYSMDDLFYYNPTDIKYWTELKDQFFYLLDLSFKSIKDANKQLFYKNFGRLNKLISLLASSVRLSHHDFQDGKYENSIKRKFKRIYSSYSQIYINSIIHLSYLHYENSSSDAQLFSYDLSKLNKSTSISMFNNSVSTNASSISTLKQLPITTMREDEEDQELSNLQVIELEINYIKLNLSGLVKIFLKVTKDKKFNVRDYDGSDSSESETFDDTEDMPQPRQSTYMDKSRFNILPQNYPRLIFNEFNGGNWCNPFFESSNSIFNVSGDDLKNKYHQKILINRGSYNTVKTVIDELKVLSQDTLQLLLSENQHLYYNKALKEERNIQLLRLIYKYLFHASSLVDILESFDFTVFCLIKRYNSQDEDESQAVMNRFKKQQEIHDDDVVMSEAPKDDHFQSNLTFDYPVVLEFFHFKQQFHYLISNIIMSTQSLTLEDPDVFKGMKEEDNPLFYNRELMRTPSQKATMLLKNLLIKQLTNNKGDSISLNPDTLMVSYLKRGEKYFQDLLPIIKSLIDERETIINYATRVMHDDFNGQLLVIERNNTMGSHDSKDDGGFMTGKKSSKDTPWYLEGDDEFDLLLDMKGNVKGGSKEALICHLTHHDLFDSTFNTSFLLTFGSMMSVNELINFLILRFNIGAPEGLSYEEYNLWISKKQNPMRIRVLNIMKLLLEKYWSKSYYSETLMDRWLSFLQNSNVLTFSISKTLINHLQKLKKGEVVMIEREPAIPKTRTPAPLVRPSLVKKLKLLDIDYVELARQLTIREFKLYSKITKYQCLAKVWGKKSGLNENFDNITDFIKSSNQLTNFVSYMILRKDDIKKRVQIIRYFVQVAEKCRQYNNFSSMTAIISALYSSPIHRLKKTWNFVSTDTSTHLQNMNKLMNSSRNFNEYRDVLKFIGSEPCVPFFGVYLSDLTFIYHGNPDTLLNRSRMLNFSKRAKTADILIGLDRFKNTGYNLLLVPEIQKYLEGWFDKCPTIDEQYQLSLNLEPRENDSSKKTFPFSKN